MRDLDLVFECFQVTVLQGNVTRRIFAAKKGGGFVYYNMEHVKELNVMFEIGHSREFDRVKVYMLHHPKLRFSLLNTFVTNCTIQNNNHTKELRENFYKQVFIPEEHTIISFMFDEIKVNIAQDIS